MCNFCFLTEHCEPTNFEDMLNGQTRYFNLICHCCNLGFVPGEQDVLVLGAPWLPDAMAFLHANGRRRYYARE